MSANELEATLGRLRAAGQEHLLQYWSELNSDQRASLLQQISAIDFDRLAALWSSVEKLDPQDSPAAKAARATPPSKIVRVPRTEADHAARAAARAIGEQLLREGKVGAILVAGGEGSRLGFPHPKGMFPIGPVSGNSLYQMLAEQLLARGRRSGRPIPYCVMTSDATDAPTQAFFQRHDWFGVDPADIRFFRQGIMPAVDRHTGKILLARKHELALNPDGHGGMLEALHKSGTLDWLRERGVECLYYHQVDNPLARVCDPEFLGFHRQLGASVTTKCVVKATPQEKMGALIDVDGKTEIIEYSDLPKDQVERLTPSNEAVFAAGSTAIHVFNRDVLEHLSASGSELPFHRAVKKVKCLDEAGQPTEPTVENAIKYERFIFDVLPLAGNGLVVEARRHDEFCPLKNATGEFSAEHVQRSLHALHAGWLAEAGIDAGAAHPIEISPLVALGADDLKNWKPKSPFPPGPLYLGPQANS